MTRLLVYGVTKLTHHIHTIGNHDEYDAHILCKRNDKVTEVLCLNHRCLLIQMMEAHQSLDDSRNAITKVITHLLHSGITINDTIVEYDGNNAITTQTYLVNCDKSRLQRHYNGIEAKDIKLDLFVIDSLTKYILYLGFITREERVANLTF